MIQLGLSNWRWLVLLALPLLFGACVLRRFPKHFNALQLTSNNRQIRKAFRDAPLQPKIFYFRSEGRKFRGWQIGHDSLPVTLLLHGAPSSMVKFRRWFQDSTFYQKTRLVAIDRPGYGRSGLGRAEVSIARQAKLLWPLVDSLSKNNRITLFGSSYGGSVAARLAMDRPDKIGALVLLSASVQPGAESYPPIGWKVRRRPWLFPRVARVATLEKFTHTVALHGIQDGWKNIQCPTWILHGRQDSLIYFSNAEYARERLINAPVTFMPFDSARHNIFWRQMDVVKGVVLDALQPRQSSN